MHAVVANGATESQAGLSAKPPVRLVFVADRLHDLHLNLQVADRRLRFLALPCELAFELRDAPLLPLMVPGELLKVFLQRVVVGHEGSVSGRERVVPVDQVVNDGVALAPALHLIGETVHEHYVADHSRGGRRFAVVTHRSLPARRGRLWLARWSPYHHPPVR